MNTTKIARSPASSSHGLFDLLVVGGGIVGASVARDAAMRGLKVRLVDRHDFAFGTSSRSSRLLHGGMRYLAQGRVGLVREASLEKRILHRIAPHLAAPLAFIFPTYRGSDWPLWQMRIGVKLYDLLCSGRNLGASTGLSAAEVLRALPGLQTDGLTGAVRYFDGLTNDARLVIDTLRSAAEAGATVANYVRFVGALREDKGWVAELTDEMTGENFSVTSRAIVNATGPWADKLPHSSIRLRCTKGIHLVLDHARLPVPDAVAITEGARILFVIPWGERVIVGTTDTDFPGPPDDVPVDAADVDYVLAAANRFFPAARLTTGDIVSSWAGLRPLLEDRHGNPSDISRSHLIQNAEPGWWDVAGGKLTTCRLMAEQTVDQIVKKMRMPAAPCVTARQPLLPAEMAAGVSGILPPAVGRDLVAYYCEQEWAVHLDDVMTRRTDWRHYHRDSDVIARRVLDWMGEIHNWSGPEKAAEWENYTTGRAWPATRAPGTAPTETCSTGTHG
ncbi:MAG: glycerol-3-phosphate dehydrogenase/oxidase [Candidatus Didemnitutus sp.]|nr:glycerol-3-phosphate dehydrogenase/oxidase [Candidatus Didemnitutus sp.]